MLEQKTLCEWEKKEIEKKFAGLVKLVLCQTSDVRRET